MLPNRMRPDSLNVVTGFHAAIVSSGPGNEASGTNVLAMNVTGNSTMNAALLTTSTLGTIRPTNAITHENA
jgi:hypothetical protein